MSPFSANFPGVPKGEGFCFQAERLRELPARMRNQNSRHSGSRSGKVNSADKLYLVIESVKMDTKHCRRSTTPAPADGAGGSLMK
jgi:hypothetical protein